MVSHQTSRTAKIFVIFLKILKILSKPVRRIEVGKYIKNCFSFFLGICSRGSFFLNRITHFYQYSMLLHGSTACKQRDLQRVKNVSLELRVSP